MKASQASLNFKKSRTPPGVLPPLALAMAACSISVASVCTTRIFASTICSLSTYLAIAVAIARCRIPASPVPIAARRSLVASSAPFSDINPELSMPAQILSIQDEQLIEQK